MNKNYTSLRPQDVLIALKILLIEKGAWKVMDIANSLEMSQSEISQGLKRLQVSKLLDSKKKHILHTSFFEFLIYGLKYVYPMVVSSIVRGIATAHSAKVLNMEFNEDPNDIFVWEYEKGTTRGQSLLPLYRTVPIAAAKDNSLYELLALLDVIRIGRVREVMMAKQLLEKRIIGEK
ncbi:MAG: hypothetical protein HQK50_18795 [Oligoflexia bacterium]|nr:hypothetical protein [Oligoflexia bacterium]